MRCPGESNHVLWSEQRTRHEATRSRRVGTRKTCVEMDRRCEQTWCRQGALYAGRAHWQTGLTPPLCETRAGGSAREVVGALQSGRERAAAQSMYVRGGVWITAGRKETRLLTEPLPPLYADPRGGSILGASLASERQREEGGTATSGGTPPCNALLPKVPGAGCRLVCTVPDQWPPRLPAAQTRTAAAGVWYPPFSRVFSVTMDLMHYKCT